MAFNAERKNSNNVINEICSVICGEEGIVHIEERSFIHCLNRVLPQPKKISDQSHELEEFPHVFSRDPWISDYRKYVFHSHGT
jgi:hypothetical protein